MLNSTYGIELFFQSIFQIFTSLTNMCPLFDSYIHFLDIFVLQIVIFGHATALFYDVGSLELFVVRLAVTNPIIDPWIYILFRKENIFAITRKTRILLGQKKGCKQQC